MIVGHPQDYSNHFLCRYKCGKISLLTWVIRTPFSLAISGMNSLNFKALNFRWVQSTHPQSDGQTEVINRCLEQYHRCFASQKLQQWNHFLPWAAFWYNTTYHHSTSFTPFQALYVRPPPTITNYFEGWSAVAEEDKVLQSRYAVLKQLKPTIGWSSTQIRRSERSKLM